MRLEFRERGGVGRHKIIAKQYMIFAGLPTVDVSVAKPIFCVVLYNDEECVVEAEWPDGTIERIEAFKDNYEAADWITNQSERWLQDRVMTD